MGYKQTGDMGDRAASSRRLRWPLAVAAGNKNVQTGALYWSILLATLLSYVVLTQTAKMWLIRKARL